MPNGHNKLSSYPGDEIPGYSTFIYSENRDRLPHEFVNDWKFFQRSIGTISGKNQVMSMDRGQLISEIQDLEANLSALQNEEESSLLSIERLEEEAKQKQANFTAQIARTNDALKLKHALEIENKNQKEQRERLEIKLRQQEIKTTEFGKHKSDCKISRIKRKGRSASVHESMCTCGWHHVKEDLKANGRK